ncbi:hypothetical protein [Solicola gregarius]|uniref:Uncharacterized protein n=1 Tax=Solicola gregarius TaxID=2908642 RepID=A0AA46YLJ5_9ACTN|nr:hypothetical protein [Solicola gregarius]UYM04933.1 hypothetical protein L0C25_20795 [Solicola gregarius]
MHPPRELGRPVSSHHPINPILAVAACALPGVLIGLGLWFGPVGSATIAALAFVVTTALLLGLFAESLFVRQQVFEHGLLLSSTIPLTPRYAIPYATIDPESIDAQSYRRPKGAADVTDAFARRYRQAPYVGVVTFVGIAPTSASRLARGRAQWTPTIAAADALPRHLWARSLDVERWYVSMPHNGRAAADLRRRVADADADARRST